MVHQKMAEMRRLIIKTSAAAGEGHIPSALSVLDILWVLYERILKIYPSDATHPDRDIFILSKGHASLALYAVLAEKGFFPASELETFGGFESRFGGHPDRNKVPGVEASTGSLGHGFPMAVGVALGLRIQKKTNRVFVLIGDGEINEGTVWESILLGAHHNLSNLCCIVDYNHSTDRALKVGDLAAKFRAFGWADRVIDGHDYEQIHEALVGRDGMRPRAVIAETIKGKGCKPMEQNPAWHHRSPLPDELTDLLKGIY